jgi:hypothetical protein
MAYRSFPLTEEASVKLRTDRQSNVLVSKKCREAAEH